MPKKYKIQDGTPANVVVLNLGAAFLFPAENLLVFYGLLHPLITFQLYHPRVGAPSASLSCNACSSALHLAPLSEDPRAESSQLLQRSQWQMLTLLSACVLEGGDVLFVLSILQEGMTVTMDHNVGLSPLSIEPFSWRMNLTSLTMMIGL